MAATIALKEQTKNRMNFETGYLFCHVETKACEKKATGFFLCCIVENWRFRQPIFELLFIKMSSGFQTVGHFYCLIFPQNSELRQGKGQFF